MCIASWRPRSYALTRRIGCIWMHDLDGSVARATGCGDRQSAIHTLQPALASRTQPIWNTTNCIICFAFSADNRENIVYNRTRGTLHTPHDMNRIAYFACTQCGGDDDDVHRTFTVDRDCHWNINSCLVYISVYFAIQCAFPNQSDAACKRARVH